MSDESKISAKPPEQSPEAPSPQTDPQNNNDPKPRSAAPAPEGSQANEKNSNNGHEKLSAWDKFERLVKIIECAALFGGVATAFFIGYQWQEMRKASGDAEKSIELVGKQVDIMQSELTEFRENRSQFQRAWIYVSKPSLELPYCAGHIGVVATISNTGSTPAMIDKDVCTIEATDYSTTNVIWATTNTTGFIVAPYSETGIETTDGLTGEKDFELLLEKKEELHFLWKITYRDTFNNVRHSDFGFKVTGTTNDYSAGTFFLPCGELRMD